MALTTRPAITDDVPAMVAMIEDRRARYEGYQPIFWAKAERSAEMSQMWFAHLVGHDDTDVLVLDEDEAVAGFAIVERIPVPPVYRAGPAIKLDDFCIADQDRWDDLGHVLLDAVRDLARQKGFEMLIVVSAQLDEARNAFLEREGLTVASVWYDQPL